MPQARGFAPDFRIDIREKSISLRSVMDHGDFQPPSDGHGFAKNKRAANDRDAVGPAPECVAAGDGR